MSEPVRFEFCRVADMMASSPNGKFIHVQDYEKLRAEIAEIKRLHTAEFNSRKEAQEEIFTLRAENAALRAELGRWKAAYASSTQLEEDLRAQMAGMVCGTCKGRGSIQSEHWLPNGLCELINIPCPDCQPNELAAPPSEK